MFVINVGEVMKNFILLFLISILLGCTSSKASITKMEIDQNYTEINVLPFKESMEKITSSDAATRGGKNAPGTNLLAQAIDNKTGIYTYGFDKNDFSVLRSSIIQSLNVSSAITSVIDFETSSKESEFFLDIQFRKSGIEADWEKSSCILEGSFELLDRNRTVLSTANFNIRESSSFSVSGSKNQAIEELIKQLAKFLSGKNQ